jgi:hypothetical protein
LYIAVAAIGHLLWEVAQLPFYTIWRLGTPWQITVAVVHCTGGDILITAVTLAVAACLARLFGWSWLGIPMIGTAIALGIAYTVFSEWLNVTVWRNWTYTEAMPVVPPLRTGLTPLLQWLAVPSLAFLTLGATREQIRNLPPFRVGGPCASLIRRKQGNGSSLKNDARLVDQMSGGRDGARTREQPGAGRAPYGSSRPRRPLSRTCASRSRHDAASSSGAGAQISRVLLRLPRLCWRGLPGPAPRDHARGPSCRHPI